MRAFIAGILFVVLVLTIMSFLLAGNDDVTGSIVVIDNLLINKSKTEEIPTIEKVVDENITPEDIIADTLETNKKKLSTLNKIKNFIFRPNFNPDIIKSIVNLRENSKVYEKSIIASQIVEINEYIEEINSDFVNNPWQETLNCAYSGCDDELYLRLINSIVSEDDDTRSDLIHEIIQTALFWNSKNTLFFSQTLTNADKLIEELDDDIINQKWDSIIKCNGECEGFNDQIFSIIDIITAI